MGVFHRRYPNGRVSKDWYIDYRIHGKRYKRRIGLNKKLAEQVLMDIELKDVKGVYLGIHEERKIRFDDLHRNTSHSPKAPKLPARMRAMCVRCNGSYARSMTTYRSSPQPQSKRTRFSVARRSSLPHSTGNWRWSSTC
jgi:hypothetical protein